MSRSQLDNKYDTGVERKTTLYAKGHSTTVYSEYALEQLLQRLEREGSQLRCVVRYSSNHILVKWQ